MPATAAVQNTATNGSSTLADILASQGALSPDRAQQVKMAEIQSGKPQEEIITSQNLVSEEALTKAKAVFYNIPFVDLATMPSAPEALNVLPQEVAERFRVYPVSIDSAAKQLNLAMADPLDLTAIEFIEQKTALRVKPEAAVPSKVDEFISTRYTTELSQQVTEAMKEVGADADKEKTVDITKTGVIREEKVSEIVSHILDFAMRARASDVHIEPQEKLTRVRYRIDGILQEKLSIPINLHDSLVSRIKILSGMKIDEKRIPQDGRFNFKAGENEVDLRVSTLPTSWGEKVVMRLLKK